MKETTGVMVFDDRCVVLWIVTVSLGFAGITRAQNGVFEDERRLASPNVSSADEEWGPSVSDDGLTLYFAARRPAADVGWDCYKATRDTVDEEFDNVVNLAGVNSVSFEEHPDISSDDLTLFFSSDRREGNFGFGTSDLYMATRDDAGQEFLNPQNLGAEVNTVYSEWGPNISSEATKAPLV